MKFLGKVGFWENEDVEVSPGIYTPKIVEHPYIGDVIKDTRQAKDANAQNDQFTVRNRISILSDLYMRKNWSSIRYVKWDNVYWKVSSVSVEFPRIILELGGVWNGETEENTIPEDPGDDSWE